MAENESSFVEQAEYLDQAAFNHWFVDHPREHEILRKLKASGAKLVIGPRGTGKTTLMLKAMHEMLQAGSDVLPVYVNFKRSLRLEPLYKSSGNATFWFNQWLLLNSVLGIVDSVRRLDHVPADIAGYQIETLRKIVDSLQAGDIERARTLLVNGITASDFADFLGASLEGVGRARAVLLFDDAAHAFSADQQRDFFDFFRTVKSPIASPKAAIYPGITDFSSAFHVGHDAEEVNIWLDPADPSYLQFMRKLLERRLSDATSQALIQDDATFRLLAFAAFGIPRSFLNMLRRLTTAEDDESQAKRKAFTRQAVLNAIEETGQTSRQIFRSLRSKLPTYATFVDVGDGLLNAAVQAVKEYNASTSKSKTVLIAIPEPLPGELRTVTSFFEYCGLVRPRGNISRGVKGTFALFEIHAALLIEANAVLAQKSYPLTDLAAALSKRDAHAFVRTTAEKLIGTKDIQSAFPLQLPPCEVCHTPRASAEAKFCLNCGSSLTSRSTFDAAVRQTIDCLPLTPRRIETITAQSSIRTVKDILLDKDHKELLKVKMIGPIWATRIARYAEEFVE